MENKRWLKLDLHLFDGAAEGAAAPSAEGEASETVENTDNTFLARKSRVRKANPLASVQYGVNEEAETESTAPIAQTDATKTTDKVPFKDLIKGDYKEDYAEMVAATVEKRLKNVKKAEATLEGLQPALGLLATRYGIDPADVDGLKKAIENDNSLYEEAALDRGLTVEQYRQITQIEAENRRLSSMQAEQERQEQMVKFISGLKEEANELKENKYPNIDFDTEINNPQMYDLLSKGVGFKAAYEATHFDELNKGILGYAAKKIAKDVTNNVASRQARPIENGLSSQAASTAKSDVSKLTKNDRAEIARRVLSGDHSIHF